MISYASRLVLRSKSMQERSVATIPGIPTVIALIAAILFDGWEFVLSAAHQSVAGVVACVLVGIVLIVCLAGLFMVQPNQGVVVQLFGKDVGTCREPGLRWTNPFYSKKPVSLRVRNFESAKLKVNDIEG